MDALVAEGVEVVVGRMGEMRVDLGRWGWFPASVNIDMDGFDVENNGQLEGQ
jgi:methylated-DNA-protein-cysteine methyltransferase-like protein